MTDLAHQALIRDIGRRLQLTSHGEARMVDRGLVALEHIRCGGDRRWERRVSTGPGDHDTAFHLATRRPSAGVVVTLCNGSWPLGDAVETMANVPLVERCQACWRTAVAGDRFALALVELADELAAEDQARAELREAARAEMVGEPPDEVTIGLPGDRWGGDPIAIPESIGTGPVAAAAELTSEGGPR